MMTTKTKTSLQLFQLIALENLAKIIGERYTGSEITNFFQKAGFPEYIHDGGTKWRYVYSVLQDIQRNINGQYQIAKIIETLCNPQEFIGNEEDFNETLKSINAILKFYSLKVNRQNGKIIVSEKVEDDNLEEKQLFYNRRFHYEIRKHGEELFLEKRYFHAVFECCKAFDKYVSEKSKMDKSGSDLMGAALSMSGTLKLNKQVSNTDRNEQEGIMFLCMGVMRAIRNPKSHEPALEWNVTREDALDILSLLSFLYRQIERAHFFKV